jgi:hypothetical protein
MARRGIFINLSLLLPVRLYNDAFIVDTFTAKLIAIGRNLSTVPISELVNTE